MWFRNTWSWGQRQSAADDHADECGTGLHSCVELQHWQYGKRWLIAEGNPQLLFTENETNSQRLFGAPNQGYVKDAFHELSDPREQRRPSIRSDAERKWRRCTR